MVVEDAAARNAVAVKKRGRGRAAIPRAPRRRSSQQQQFRGNQKYVRSQPTLRRSGFLGRRLVMLGYSAL